MLGDIREFRFFHSFRFPVEEADNVRFLVDDPGPKQGQYLSDSTLLDISKGGLSFSSKFKGSIGQTINFSLQFKKYREDLSGKIVRVLPPEKLDDAYIYGIELEAEDELEQFLEQFLTSLSPERIRGSVLKLALSSRWKQDREDVEVFSLIVALFHEITRMGNKEGHLQSILTEAIHLMNAGRAAVYLIHPETNDLVAEASLGIDKSLLRIDYRQGIAGSVFTTGIPMNLEADSLDNQKYNHILDAKTGVKTKAVICYPFTNKEGKIIGVAEVANKKGSGRFGPEDEKAMKVISWIFSALFNNYGPISAESKIRRFSTPQDRELVFIGKSKFVQELRNNIIKLKDLNTSVLIEGEEGTGRSTFAKILHGEGRRATGEFLVFDCTNCNMDEVTKKTVGIFDKKREATILFKSIDLLSLESQKQLHNLLAKDQNAHLLRLVCTTDKNLEKKTEQGDFFAPLYQLISATHLKMLPLRKRIDDLEELIEYYIKQVCKRQGILSKSITPKMLEVLVNYHWPKNISELKLTLERAITYNSKSNVIDELEGLSMSALRRKDEAHIDAFSDVPELALPNLLLKDKVLLLERKMIESEIKKCFGNKSEAARKMGISREALRKKMLQSDRVIKKLNGGNIFELKPRPMVPGESGPVVSVTAEKKVA